MARGTRFLLFSCLLILQLYLAVAQSNDPPVWVDNLQIRMVSTGLSENLPVGTVIGTLRARDPEGRQVTYNVTSSPSILSVNSQSGVVTLTAPLDRERKSSYMVTVTAMDNVGNMLAHSYDARITDENDNSPRFQVPIGGYNAEIGENVPVSSTILADIRATDADLGANSRVTFTCYVPERDEGRLTMEQARRACETFGVRTQKISDGTYAASIILNRRLDYSVTRSYSLTLAASDEGSPASTSYTNVNINVQRRGDGVPRFLNAPVTVNIFEGINKDTEVGVLKVHDGDLGASKQLRIKIAQGEDGLGWFRLGRLEVMGQGGPLPQYTVPIYSNGNIDREAWDGVYEFDVEAIVLADGKETSARARTTVRVTIRDRNDNGPTFVPRDNYDIIVQEGLTTGTKLPGLDLIIKDTDEGRNSEFALTLVDDTWGTFSLSPDKCTGECAVSLVVENARSMDFEDGRYRRQIVRVVARETSTSEQRSATGTVTVNLQDLNDNAPVFPQTQYRLSVREDRPVGFLVATIRASDADSGNFGTVRYRLVADDTPAALQWFEVNEMNGQIRLAKALDFERQRTLSLTYEARDLGGRFRRVPFEVTVLNFNDQGPVFVRDNYDVVLNEGTTQLRINITAVDREQSGVVTYRIASGNTPDNAFSINRFTGVISLLRPVSFEDTAGRGYIRLVIEASDGGRGTPQTTTIPITITVQNIANQRPRFTQAFYAGSVSEIATAGQSVVTVRASDSDSGNNGQVRYQISSGSFNNFNIDPTSGVIRVSQNANLDLQTGSSAYRMTVQAVDGGSPALTAETQVTVTVTDANNKSPQFVQNVYLTSLLESAPVGTSILQLVANDPDSSRRLEYSIRRETVSAKNEAGQNLSPSMLANYRDTFSVNILSGIIQSQRMLSRDQVGEISFVAQVRDGNAQVPQVQTATATVIVTIESAKRQQLEFTPPITPDNPDIRVTIPEEEDVGYVVYNLVALDPNTNRPVQNYDKVSGTDPMNYFFVDQLRGRITLNRRLDYERLSNRDLSFQVRATTTGTPVLSAVARIIVTVRDVNDNSPVFSQSSYKFSVLEGQQFPEQIGVMATDADSGEYGRIRYTLTGKGRQFFYIDPNMGSISVARNMSLDREQIERGEFELLVKATDNPDGRSNDQRQTDVPLTIVVNDVNDNRPMFPIGQYNFYTRDNARAGTALGTVKATDADVMNGDGGAIIYTIASGNTDDLFLIDRTTGVLRNQKDLTGYAKPLPYELKVLARDNGVPFLTNTVMVNVFISDLRGNDDIPHIISPSKDGQVYKVPEDAGQGTNITRINAVARGAAAGTVSFRFLDNPLLRDQTYFRIDPLTGVISLVKPLDRESQEQYQLIVVVENKLAATEIKRSLFVNVSDTNDNSPSFLTCPGIHVNPIVVQVKEEGPRVADILQVKGCDLDAPPNNNVYYYIVKGNDPIPGQSMPPFSIDRSTGLIRTQTSLDRETSDKFLLYIKVSENANLNVTNYVVNASLGSIQMVKVEVVDIDDNGPSFGKDTTFSTGVVATARFRTKLLIITAQDLDTQTPFARTIYSLDDTKFIRDGEDTRNTPDAFTIEPHSGEVMTNLPDYLDYQNGFFTMKVKAVGQGTLNQTLARSTTATLNIYVIRETQRLKFYFKLPPEMVAKTRGEFMRKVNETLGDDIRVNDDSIHYHTDENAIVIDSATDLCFHMVKDNRVVQPDDALKILEDNRNNLQPLYQEYSVSGPGLCSLKAVTYRWADHWWLWWILIALTLLIILISLIMICVLCCCWKRPLPEPYVNLDPGIDYMPNKQYEWQQRTVRME